MLQSWGLYFFSHSANKDNLAMIVNNSIQIVNFFLYIIAQIGLYNLLRFFQIKRNNILLTLSLLNFFPLMIALRITMKSEILVLAFLPWIILLIEIFLKTKKSIYLFTVLPMLTIVLLSKGLALGAISIFLFLTYIKKMIFINKKLLIFLTIVFISLSFLLFIEDSNINKQNLLEPTHADKYDNLAPVSIIYKIEIKDGVFSDKKIMFTGTFKNMSRSEAKSIAENNGGKVLGTVSKKLDFLVVGNSKPTKKKVDQAKNLNIKILSENDWNKILNS